MIAKLNKKRRGDGSARLVAQKPGFLRSFWMKAQDCGKNPVSDSPLRGRETGFFAKFVGETERLSEKPGF